MYPFERKNKILARLQEIGQINIGRDAKLLNVSTSTLHRDLEDLQKAGFVTKVVGGAVPAAGGLFETHFDKRMKTRVKEKIAIARKAVARVQDDTSIFIDHSSSTVYLAREIKRRPFRSLVVLTNSLQVPLELGNIQGIRVISTGGFVEGEFKALSGRWVVEALKGVNLHQVFLSVGAVSVEHGLMTQIHFISELIPELFKRSQHINVLVDSGKFFKLGTFQISSLKPPLTIFSDKGLPQDIRAAVEKKGVSVIV
jgi:DeoR family fructose operon transcriptional repressor